MAPTAHSVRLHSQPNSQRVGGGGCAFYYTYIYSGKRYSCEGAELVCVLVAETIHPVCMCAGGGRGGERGGRAFYYTYIYSGKRESCEGATLVGILVAETIHPACMREGGGRGGERRTLILLHLHIQREKIVLRGSRAGRRFGCRNHPSCVYV